MSLSKHFFLYLFLFITNIVTAQSIFHFEYRFIEPYRLINHTIFLVRNDYGGGFMRDEVSIHDTGYNQSGANVYQYELKEQFLKNKQGVTDSNVITVEGFNPKMVHAKGFSVPSNPVLFLFVKDKNTGYYEADRVVPANGIDSAFQETDKPRLLSTEDLKESFVASFFSPGESFYDDLVAKNFYEKPPMGSNPNDPGDGAPVNDTAPRARINTFHLIIAANTNDEYIGTSCEKDLKRTTVMFKVLAEIMDFKFEPVLLYDTNFSFKKVTASIKSLEAGPGDVVVFYYSGHGFADKDTFVFPHLDLRSSSVQKLKGNTVNIQQVYDGIVKKGARVNLVLSDCCNTDINAFNKASGEFTPTRGSGLEMLEKNCMRLFEPDRPVSILMTAASRGETSAGNDSYGGFFSFFFRTTLDDKLKFSNTFNLDQSDITWELILEETKKRTIGNARKYLCRNEQEKFETCRQKPMSIISYGKQIVPRWTPPPR